MQAPPSRWGDLLSLLACGFGAAAACLAPSMVRADEGLVYLVHEPATKPASGHPPLIVLMHGAGANERDMIGLWHDLPGTLVVISPRAPFHDANGGWRWYRKETREADLALSKKIVDVIVANAVKRFDADPARVFVGGFSQGGVMTYEVALREPGMFAGAAVLSGILFPSETASLAPEASRTPFFLAHGTADAVIPYPAAISAKDALAKLGIPAAFHAYQGMSHTVGPEETRDLSDWLSSKLGPRPQPETIKSHDR